MIYYAHLEHQGANGQLLRDHNRRTAEIAGSTLRPAGLYNAAYLAGLLHDLGKYTFRFQRYLRGESGAKRGSVIHTFQGCRLLIDKYHVPASSDAEYFTAELLALAIGSHHGLFDCVDAAQKSGLQYRAEKQDIDFEEAVSAFFADCAASEEVERLFSLAVKEVEKWLARMDACESTEADRSTEYAFSMGLLARLLTSAVIEGDRTDTASYMCGWPQNPTKSDTVPPWQERLAYMESKLSKLPSDTPIALARQEISKQCREHAELPGGIYRLYVPTGGGKTLGALRYALAHAAKWKKQRLIFTSPLLSILEQNAKQIRQYLGDDRLVLEHHSNVIQLEKPEDALDERELLVQSWEAPVILTTLVQFLNTLFEGKTTAIRRFHALCDSVIVIDEVQSVPVKLLSLFNRAVFFLSTYCGATIVLSSATQPCLEKARHPVSPLGDIVPYDAALWQVFTRTAIIPLPALQLSEMPTLIRSRMAETSSMLVVCNKKGEAAELAEQTQSDLWESFHLSAGMCMQHRRDVLMQMEAALEKSRKGLQKVLCISTQVIEAGVDISFATAMRLLAGMDSVIQTAGRCNRNGESPAQQPVYLINCKDEKLGKLREIQQGKTASIELLAASETDSKAFDEDLSSDAAIRFYYHCLYRNMNKDAQDCVIFSRDGKAEGSLYDYLSANEKNTLGAEGIEAFCFWQAFKTAGQKFTVFDENTTDILIPYGEGEQLIAALCSERAERDLAYRAEILKRTNGYTVSVYEYQKNKLEAAGAIYSICGGSLLVLQKAYYDSTIGIIDNGKPVFWEV